MSKKLYTGNDFLDRLAAGPYVNNPQYNPKTKAGRTQPSVLVNTSPGSLRGGAFSNTEFKRQMLKQTNTSLGLTTEEFEKQLEHGITPSIYNSDEELNRVYAESQSAFDQFGNFLMQAGVGEIILGTLEGFGNIYDGIANTFTGDNYSRNAYTKLMADAKERIKEKFEIHQKNPGASFQLGDFGWWMNGMINTATTLSLMLPAAGWAKGISTLGKFTYANKLGRMATRGVSRGIAKATTKGVNNANKFNAINSAGAFNDINALRTIASRAGKIEKGILYGSAVIGQATLSRAGESFLEAKSIFEDVKTSTMENLQNMIDADAKNGTSEFEKFIENNPEFKNADGSIMSVEDIAHEIARKSANKTFYNDWWMLANDVIQYMALGSLWGKAAKRRPTSRERIEAKNLKSKLGGAKDEDLIKNNWINRRKEDIRQVFKDPLNSPLQIIATEGFEEIYQGIQQEKGLEIATKYFDNTYTSRTLGSYLTDSHIWEQGFWGAIGGLAFNAGGNAFRKGVKAAKGLNYKKTMTAEAYERWKRSDDKIAIEQINSTTDKIQSFINDMNMIENGKNPYKTVIDKSTGRRVIKDGRLINAPITNENEKDALKQIALQRFIDNTTVDAVDYGIFDLMKEIIGSNEFNKYVADNGLQLSSNDTALSQQVANRMDEVAGIYYSELDNVNSIVDDPNPFTVISAARNITNNKLRLADYNFQLANIDAQLAIENDSNTDFSAFAEKQLFNTVNKIITQLDKRAEELQNNLNVQSISTEAYKINMQEINRLKRNLLQYLSNNTTEGLFDSIRQSLKEFREDYLSKDLIDKWNQFKLEYSRLTSNNNTPSETISNLYKNRAAVNINKVMTEAQIPVNKKDYQDIYDEFGMSMDAHTIKRINTVIDKVKNYLQNAENLEDAIDRVLRSETGNKKLDEDLKFLRFGYNPLETDDIRNQGRFNIDSQLSLIIKSIREEKEKANETKDEAKRQGTEIPAADPSIAQDENDDESDIFVIPSTGEEIKANPTTTADTAITDNTNFPVKREPSGVQTTSDSDIVVDNSIPVDNNPLSIDRTQQQLEEDAKIAEGYESQTIKAELEAAQYIAIVSNKESGRFENIFEAIDRNDHSEYEKFIKELVDFLISRGYDNNVANVIARRQFANSATNIFVMRNKSQFAKLAQQLALGFTEEGSKKYSVTELLDGAGIDEALEDFIKAYAELVELEQLEDGRYVVNIQSLFDFILNDEKINVTIAAYVYNNINAFIAKHDGSKFKFTGFYNDQAITADEFFNRLREQKAKVLKTINNMHISPVEPEHRDKNYTKALEEVANGRAKAYVVEQRDQYGHVSNLSVYVDLQHKKGKTPVKIGILRTVEVNEDLTNIATLNHYSGFGNKMSINGDKMYLDCDNLFYALIEHSANDVEARQLYNILLDYYLNVSDIIDKLNKGVITDKEANKSLGELITKDIAAKILNNKYIKDILSEEVYKIYDVGNKTEIEKARTIARSISSILFYGQHFDESDPTNKSINTMSIDKKTMRERYEDWKQKVYSNYVNTYELQKKLGDGKSKVDINLNVPYYVMLNTIPKSKDNINIADAGFNIDPTSETYTPFVFVNNERHLIGEDGTDYGQADSKIKPNSIGFLVHQNDGLNLVAYGVRSLDLSNTPIARAVRDEILNLINRQLNNKNPNNHQETFDNIRDTIEELFGAGGLFTFNDNSIRVLIPKDKSLITLAIEDANKNRTNILTLFSKDKDNTKNSNAIGIYSEKYNKQITIYNDSFALIDRNTITDKTEIENTISKALDLITKSIKLNRTNTPITNRTKNGLIPKVFRRENGKFIVTLNNKDYVYESYADFILQNKGFTTNVDGSSGSFVTGFLNEDNLTIDSVIKQTENVEQTANTNVTDLLFTNLPKDRKEVKTKDVLEAAGVEQEKIDILLGTNSKIPIVGKTIRVDRTENPEENAHYSLTDNKIYITSKGAAVMNNNPINAIRLILHENIHKHFNDKRNLTKEQKDRIIRELREVYDYTISKLEQDKNSGRIREDAYNSIINVLNKATSYKTEDVNMEEFLTECLTQPVLVQYLNNTDYHREVNIDGIPNNKKTIFQKIIDVILKLLGINNNNIKNNSILAREYEILSKTSNSTTNEIFSKPIEEVKSDITDDTNTQPKDDTNISNVTLSGEDLLNNNEDFNLDDYDVDSYGIPSIDDMYAATDLITGKVFNDNNFQNNKEDSNFETNISTIDTSNSFNKEMIKIKTIEWVNNIKDKNPKVWNEVIESLNVFTELQNNNIDNDNKVIDLLVDLCDKQYYNNLENKLNNEIDLESNNNLKINKQIAWNRIKNAISNFWNWVQRNILHSKPKNWQDFVDEIVQGKSKSARLRNKFNTLTKEIFNTQRELLNSIFEKTGIDIQLEEGEVNVEQVAVSDNIQNEVIEEVTKPNIEESKPEDINVDTTNDDTTKIDEKKKVQENQQRQRNANRELYKKAFKKGGEKAYDLLYELHGGIISAYPNEFLNYLKEHIGVYDDIATVVEKAHDYLIYDFHKKNKDLFNTSSEVKAIQDVHSLLADKGYSFLEHTFDNGKAIGVKMMYRDKFISSGKTDISYTPQEEHGRSVICYYGNPDARLENQYVFTVTKNNAVDTPTAYELAANPSLITPEWESYLESVGRKNEDGTYNLDKLEPNFSDPFSLSHLMIRIGKRGIHDVEIISRYNHGAFDAKGNYQIISGQPNATLGNDLNKLADGLFESLMNFKNIDPADAIESTGDDIKIANNGKIYIYNEEYNGMYFGNDFWIDNANDAHVIDKNKERLFGTTLVTKDNIQDLSDPFGLNNNNHPIYKVSFTKDGIEFYEEVETITEEREVVVKGEKKIITKDVQKGHVKTTFKNGVLETESTNSLTVDKYANLFRATELVANNLTKVYDYFLGSNFTIEKITLNNIKSIQSDFLKYNHNIKVLNLPNVETVGDYFVISSTHAVEINMPNLREVGHSFMSLYNSQDNSSPVDLYLPNLETTGNFFMQYANLAEVNLPNLKSVGLGFLLQSMSKMDINTPSLVKAGNDFVGGGFNVKSLNAPMLSKVDSYFMYGNTKIRKQIEEQISINNGTQETSNDSNIRYANTEMITAAEIYATPIANGATDNAFGVRVVNNLSDFVNSFPIQYRASIQQILADNELNYTCQ